MYGAILGDIIGSPFEFDRGNKTKDFELFTRGCRFTDDSVMTIAIAEALIAIGPGANEMEIEEAALKKEDDRLSKERLEHLQQELAELREEFAGKKAQWDNEKVGIERVQKIREEIEQVNKEIEKAQHSYDLEKAAELQYGRLPQLQKQLEAEEEKVKDEDMSLVHESVTD